MKYNSKKRVKGLFCKIIGLWITWDRKIKWNKITKYSLEKNAAFRRSVGMYQALIMLADVMIKTN